MKQAHIALMLLLVLFACEKNDFFVAEGDELSFSTDSIVFDTVFSGVGSATKHLKVYNRSNNNIVIPEVYLAKRNESKYRLNIDGRPTNYVSDLKINAKDSLYIFVEVTINTNEDALLEQDSLIFANKTNVLDIKLLAWGQDVHLINGEILGNSSWDNDKPYLVYNSMLIDTNQTLSINPGTKVYFHRGSRMYVAGTLNITGTFEQPVMFQGDRLEQMYSDVPGQWEGIWLMNGSKHNQIEFAIIKNAIIGIQVDTLADLAVPTLKIANTRIEQMSFAGIYAQGSTIFATNCLISDCGYYNLALTIGGSYDFYHCTFVNFWKNSFRSTPLLVLNNYYMYQNLPILRNIDHAGFYNCLIWGDRENEIYIDAYPEQGTLNYEFDHCLLKYNSDSEINTELLSLCLNGQDPLFLDIDNYNYSLTELSPAINKGSGENVALYPLLLNYDLLMHSRMLDDAPDIGVFEFVE